MDRGRAARIHHTCTSCTQRHATRVKGRRNSHHSRAQVPPCTLAFTCSTLAGASLIRRCCSHGKGRAGRAQTKGGATFLARGRPVWEPVALCAAAVVRSAVQGCCCLVCVAGCAQRAAAQPQQDKIPAAQLLLLPPINSQAERRSDLPNRRSDLQKRLKTQVKDLSRTVSS
jgi:hypothetical protein